MKTIARLVVCLLVGIGSLWGVEPAEFQALKAAAEKGDRDAMFRLAMIYDGAFVDLYDNRLDASTSKFGAAITDTNADLGELYALVDKWADRAAELGHPEAMLNKAHRLRLMNGSAATPESIEWMRKSAEAGWTPAMMELAETYKGNDDELRADWLKKAASANHGPAFGLLADAYLNGVGVPYNPKRAIEWLTKGTQAPDDPTSGNTDATNCMLQLGRLHLDGKHVAKDEAVAAGWLRRAADAGNTAANLPLADLLVRGAGVPRDLAKARELLDASPAAPQDKQPVFAALAAAEKSVAEARAMQERVAELAPRVGSAWAKRLLAPPPELAGMEPVDVYFMMTEKVAPPPAPNAAVDHNKFIPGTISFSSMRMWLVGSEAEFEEWYRKLLARSPNAFPVRIRGSDLTGGRIMLGWVAWVCVNDWWPEGYGYPNEGVGYCYGAASLDEALELAYGAAVRALRKHYQGPIRCIQVEAGVSARPKWDLYRANKTFNDVCKLSYSFVLETPAKEREARQFGFTMTPPEDPKEFPRFARVTLRQRRYAQVIVEPGMAKDHPRLYGSYGLMNAPVPLNPRPVTTKEEVLAAGFPEYFYKEAYFSDEPPAFTILPF